MTEIELDLTGVRLEISRVAGEANRGRADLVECQLSLSAQGLTELAERLDKAAKALGAVSEELDGVYVDMVQSVDPQPATRVGQPAITEERRNIN